MRARCALAMTLVALTGCSKSEEQKKHDSCRKEYEELKPKLQAELKASEDALRAWANEEVDANAEPKLAAFVVATKQMSTTFESAYFDKNNATTECYRTLRNDPDFGKDYDERVSPLGDLALTLPRMAQLATGSSHADVVDFAHLADSASIVAARLGNPPRLTALGNRRAELNARLDRLYKQEDEQLREMENAPPPCNEAVTKGQQAFQAARDANCVNEQGELITDVARSECGMVNAAVTTGIDTITKSCGFSLHNATRALHGLQPE